MYDLISIGETMQVFIPDHAGPLRYSNSYHTRIAGAESNVAIGLQKLGYKTGWISKLGEDEFGHFVLNNIRGEGIDTSQVVMDSQYKTGIMFKESTFFNETKVVYYRENSAATHLSIKDIDENYIKKTNILHLTGITPVLSDSCKNVVYRLIEIAKKHNITISFDPNIRMKLWGNHDYSDLIKDILLKSNIVLLGLEEAKKLFNIDDKNKIVEKIFSYKSPKYLAIKDGEKGAWVASKKDKFFHVKPQKCKSIDSVGAGDAFNVGFLYGFIEKMSLKKCGEIGNILGALATQTSGDIEGFPSKNDLKKIIENKITYR